MCTRRHQLAGAHNPSGLPALRPLHCQGIARIRAQRVVLPALEEGRQGGEVGDLHESS